MKYKILNNNNSQSDIYKELINLKNDLNNKNKIIEQQKLEIQNLKNLLNNKSINEKKIKENENIINKLRNELNKKNDELNKKNDELNKKNGELNKKNDELNKLKIKLFDNKNILDLLNDNKFAINFISVDQHIHFPVSCNLNDSIAKLEEIVYNQYPEYKEYNTYLTVNGEQIKRFKTIKENGIKEGNAITINIYEE